MAPKGVCFGISYQIPGSATVTPPPPKIKILRVQKAFSQGMIYTTISQYSTMFFIIKKKYYKIVNHIELKS